MASKKIESSEKTGKKKRKRHRLLQMTHHVPMPISEVKKKLRPINKAPTKSAYVLIFNNKQLFALIVVSSILIFLMALFFANQ